MLYISSEYGKRVETQAYSRGRQHQEWQLLHLKQRQVVLHFLCQPIWRNYCRSYMNCVMGKRQKIFLRSRPKFADRRRAYWAAYLFT